MKISAAVKVFPNPNQQSRREETVRLGAEPSQFQFDGFS